MPPSPSSNIRSLVSPEHSALGDTVGAIIANQGSPSDPSAPLPVDDLFERQIQDRPNTIKIKTAKGASLTFGDVIALAGDFIAVGPLCTQPSIEYKRFLFMYDFAVFFLSNSRDYLEKIIAQIEIERDKMREGAAQGKKYGDVSHEIEMEMYNKYCEIVGKIKYSAMLAYNFDHFGKHAIDAYKIGHQLAIEIAEKTGNMNMAYGIEAFATHFLTDCFSAGHVRTPRLELHDQVFISWLGDYLSHFQHSEDGEHGLWVRNPLGRKWKLFGDGHLCEDDSDNRTTQEMAFEALKISLMDIFKAGSLYQNDSPLKNSMDVYRVYSSIKNKLPRTLGTYEAEKYLPEEDPDRINFPALFRVNAEEKVERRTTLPVDYSATYSAEDIQSGKYHTYNWKGWPTKRECEAYFNAKPAAKPEHADALDAMRTSPSPDPRALFESMRIN
jgi:hypothetical protein